MKTQASLAPRTREGYGDGPLTGITTNHESQYCHFDCVPHLCMPFTFPLVSRLTDDRWKANP